MSPRSQLQFEQIREESKRKILEAALKLFGQKGYAASSISAIAKVAGVSKGLIYNYYQSKEEIAQACAKQVLEVIATTVGRMNQFDDPQEKLQAIFEDYFDIVESYGLEMLTLYIRFSLELSQFDFFKDLFTETLGNYMSALVPIFQELGYENPKHAAWELGIIMDGLGLQLSTGMGEEYMTLAKEIIAKKYNVDIK